MLATNPILFLNNLLVIQLNIYPCVCNLEKTRSVTHGKQLSEAVEGDSFLTLREAVFCSSIAGNMLPSMQNAQIIMKTALHLLGSSF